MVEKHVAPVSLADIAPPDVANKIIELERVGKALKVYGLSGRDIARLITRFPQFRKMAQQKTAPGEEQLMEVGVDLAPAIIAMGLKSYDDETEKLVGENLTEEEQALLINGIMELTNPPVVKGKPFPLAKVRSSKNRNRRGRADVDTSGRDQAGTSP